MPKLAKMAEVSQTPVTKVRNAFLCFYRNESPESIVDCSAANKILNNGKNMEKCRRIQCLSRSDSGRTEHLSRLVTSKETKSVFKNLLVNHYPWAGCIEWFEGS